MVRCLPGVNSSWLRVFGQESEALVSPTSSCDINTDCIPDHLPYRVILTLEEQCMNFIDFPKWHGLGMFFHHLILQQHLKVNDLLLYFFYETMIFLDEKNL
jgi:hypothetical protein